MNRNLIYKFQQELELFVFYIANGTLNLEESDKHVKDYRDIIIDKPKIFSIIGEKYLDRLKNNTDRRNLKKEIVIDIYESNFIIEKQNRKEETKIDIYEAGKRFFENITIISNEKEKLHFEELIKSPNDIQLLFCIWGNNLKIDKEGIVTNESYCLKRAKEFKMYLFENIDPINSFTELELMHNT